jgi:hypothetical protein
VSWRPNALFPAKELNDKINAQKIIRENTSLFGVGVGDEEKSFLTSSPDGHVEESMLDNLS